VEFLLQTFSRQNISVPQSLGSPRHTIVIIIIQGAYRVTTFRQLTELCHIILKLPAFFCNCLILSLEGFGPISNNKTVNIFRYSTEITSKRNAINIQIIHHILLVTFTVLTLYLRLAILVVEHWLYTLFWKIRPCIIYNIQCLFYKMNVAAHQLVQFLQKNNILWGSVATLFRCGAN